jgi:hypothetical protein
MHNVKFLPQKFAQMRVSLIRRGARPKKIGQFDSRSAVLDCL